MAGTNYDIVDLDWLASGDLEIFAPNTTSTIDKVITKDLGSILSTEGDQILGFVQLVETWLSSDQGDWRDAPNIGCDLSEFLGRTNSRETAEAIKARIFERLTTAGVVRAGDLSIDITPVDIHSILIMLHIKARKTSKNQLAVDTLTISYLFNISDAGMVPIGIVQPPG